MKNVTFTNKEIDLINALIFLKLEVDLYNVRTNDIKDKEQLKQTKEDIEIMRSINNKLSKKGFVKIKI